jgi:hypothetical protein
MQSCFLLSAIKIGEFKGPECIGRPHGIDGGFFQARITLLRRQMGGPALALWMAHTLTAAILYAI